MGEVPKHARDRLEQIKKNVKNAYDNFKPNYDRFNEFRNFIYNTSLSSDDVNLLGEMGKPAIEFNITETYISRQLGEFYKSEPAVTVGAEDEDQADPPTIKCVEGHIRHIFLDGKNDHTRWELGKDIYSGGFSVGSIWTDYAHPMSMKQVIKMSHKDPTMCGFDPTARLSHKGDGQFCFEVMPYEYEAYLAEHPELEDKLKKLKFTRNFAGYNWSYMNGNIRILLVADYYEKKKKRVKIVELPNGHVMTMAEYKSMIADWDIYGYSQAAPAIKGEPRWTELETICRYRCMETEVIEYSETDFTMLPLIFFDGNSIMLRKPKNQGNMEQMTRPYVYHAKGAQKLKNFSGITLANEIENITQSKFMVAKEALPKEMDFLDAYKNQQKPNNMIYNAFFEQDPDKPIPQPIREVQRVPTPPEVVQTFTGTDSLIQNILGSYDASLGINDNQLSGIAIVEAATQSNAAAMPYIIGYLQGLNRMAEIILDLIPKYYTTPRTIPVMGIDRKSTYQKINQQGAPDVNYDSNVLNVKVEAGVSFAIQKNRALSQIIALQSSSEMFAQFMNEKGLPTLLDNIEIRGIDQLKLEVEDWMKEQAQIKQAAMAQQQQEAQNNPLVMKNQIDMMKVQQAGQKMQSDAQIAQGKLAIDQGKLEIDKANLKKDMAKIFADMQIAREDSANDRLRAQTERYSKQVDLAMQKKQMLHTHVRDAIELHHTIKHNNRKLDIDARKGARTQ